METSPRLLAGVLLGVGVLLCGGAVARMVWMQETLLVLPIAGPFLVGLGLAVLLRPAAAFDRQTRRPKWLGIAAGVLAAIVFLAWYIPWAGITLDSL